MQRTSKFTFLFNEGVPKSLVMLKPVDQILNLIYTTSKIKFVWINNFKKFLPTEIIKEIQAEANIKFILKQSINQLKEAINKEKPKCYFILVIPAIRQIQKQYQKQWPAQKLFTHYFTFSTQEQNNEFTTNFLKKKQLIEKLRAYKGFDSRQKCTQNFLFIDHRQVKDSHTLSKCMKAMINFNEQIVQSMIIDQFLLLVQQLRRISFYHRQRQQETFKYFAEDLRKGLTKQKAIQWYTNETQAYKLINNLLRSMRQPSEIFYLQPFYQKLFQSINQLYKKRNPQSFCCYRGGLITKQEFEAFKKHKNGKYLKKGAYAAREIGRFYLLHLQSSKAEPYYLQAIEVLQQDTKGVLLIDVSQVYRSMGQYQKALLYLNLFKSKYLNEDCPKSIQFNFMSVLGNVLQQKGENSRALQLFVNCEKILKREGKYFSIRNAQILNSKAIGLRNRGLFDDSIRTLQQSYAIYQFIYGWKNINLAFICANIANLYCQKGCYQLGLEQYKKCMNINNKLTVKNFDLEVTTLLGIAQISMNKGDYNIASNYFQKAYQLVKKGSYGKILTALCLMNQGIFFAKISSFDKAFGNLQQSRRILLEVNGKQNIHFVCYLNNMGQVLYQKKAYQKAIECFQECKNIIEQINVQNLELNLVINSNLAWTLNQMGQKSKSLLIYQDLISKLKSTEKNRVSPLYIANIFYNIGLLSLQLFQFSNAVRFLYQSKVIYQSAEIYEHPNIKIINYLLNFIGQWKCILDQLQTHKNLKQVKFDVSQTIGISQDILVNSLKDYLISIGIKDFNQRIELADNTIDLIQNNFIFLITSKQFELALMFVQLIYEKGIITQQQKSYYFKAVKAEKARQEQKILKVVNKVISSPHFNTMLKLIEQFSIDSLLAKMFKKEQLGYAVFMLTEAVVLKLSGRYQQSSVPLINLISEKSFSQDVNNLVWELLQ